MKICFLTLTGGSFFLDVLPGTSVYDIKERLKGLNIIQAEDFSLYANGTNLTGYLSLDDIVRTQNQIVITENQNKKKKDKKKNVIKQTFLQDEEEEKYEINIATSNSDSTEEDDFSNDNFDDMIVDDIKKPIKKKRRPKQKIIDPDDFDENVSQLVSLGFDLATCKKTLRSAKYDVDAAATRLFETMDFNLYSSDSSENDSFHNEEEDINKKQRFTRNKKEELGEFKELYESLSKEDKEYVKLLEKDTNQERATVLQTFIACNNNYRLSLECLLKNA